MPGWAVVVFILSLLSVAGRVEAGKPDQAPAELEARIRYYRARARGPATYPAHARLGLACLQQARQNGDTKRYEEGMRHLRLSLQYQRNYEALYGLAVGLSERHGFREAKALAQEAVETMPGSLEALGVLFDIHLALGENAAAEEILRRMSEAKPGFELRARRAAWCEARGDLPGAIAAVSESLAQLEGDAAASRRAWLEVRLGALQLAHCEAAAARAAYERALGLVPRFPLAQEHLAEWHAAHGQWAQAGTLFRELLRSRPQPAYRLALADVLRHQRQEGRARTETGRAIAEWRAAVNGGLPDGYRPLALCLLEPGPGAAEGLHWAQRDWELRRDGGAIDTLAWACWRNGRADDALRLSGEALRLGPRTPLLLLHAAVIRRGSAKEEESRALLTEALACPLSFGPFERALAERLRADADAPAASP